MTKQFYFQITDEDGEWETDRYPTKEEAEDVRAATIEAGFEVGEIMEERV